MQEPDPHLRHEPSSRRPLRLVAGASAGGHANELMRLLDAADGVWAVQPSAYVTTMAITAAGLARRGRPVHVIGESDRKKPWRAVVVLFRACVLALRLRPHCVITTGSMPLAMFAMAAKLCGAKIVWIDSVAQIDEMSLSGRLMRHVADLCLVQWPEVAARYPGTEYAGELL